MNPLQVFFSSKKNIIAFFIVIILIVAVFSSAVLINQQQIFKSRASETDTVSLNTGTETNPRFPLTDSNHNCVNNDDYLQWQSEYKTRATAGLKADFNNDGVTDQKDYAILYAHKGQCEPTPTMGTSGAGSGGAGWTGGVGAEDGGSGGIPSN